MVVIKKGAK